MIKEVAADEQQRNLLGGTRVQQLLQRLPAFIVVDF